VCDAILLSLFEIQGKTVIDSALNHCVFDFDWVVLVVVVVLASSNPSSERSCSAIKLLFILHSK